MWTSPVANDSRGFEAALPNSSWSSVGGMGYPIDDEYQEPDSCTGSPLRRNEVARASRDGEVGEYAIILSNNVATSRADIEEQGLKITPTKDGGAIEVAGEVYKMAQGIDRNYTELAELTKKYGFKNIITTADAYEEGAEEAGI